MLVLAERTGIRVSVTTMSRLLKRLGVRLGRPKPTVGLPMAQAPQDAAAGADSTAHPGLGAGRGPPCTKMKWTSI